MDMDGAEENLARLRKAKPKAVIFPTITELGEDADAIKALFQKRLDSIPPEPPEITKKILARHRKPQRPEEDVDDFDDEDFL